MGSEKGLHSGGLRGCPFSVRETLRVDPAGKTRRDRTKIGSRFVSTADQEGAPSPPHTLLHSQTASETPFSLQSAWMFTGLALAVRRNLGRTKGHGGGSAPWRARELQARPVGCDTLNDERDVLLSCFCWARNEADLQRRCVLLRRGERSELPGHTEPSDIALPALVILLEAWKAKSH